MRRLIRGLTAALLLAVLPLAANAALFVSVSFGPPLLPVYVPPPIPAQGYIWVPGYWAWDGYDYYWVPGTWVLPPAVGLLWTPGYWGWDDGVYVWRGGYWGPHVGFYGGIDYGCGYDGVGYHGGYWRGSTFVVNNTAINEAPVQRVAYNGGAGGVVARPTPAELVAAHEHHVSMSQMQLHNQQMAARDSTLRASINHGRPPVAATERAGVFHGHGVVAARDSGGPLAAVKHRSPAAAPHGSNRDIRMARTEGEAHPGSSHAPRTEVHGPALHQGPHAPPREPASRPAGHEPAQHPMVHQQAPHALPHEPASRPTGHERVSQPAMRQPLDGHAGHPQGHESPRPERPAEHGRPG